MCKELNITFIMDEVQTGVGATGKMWAFEHYLEESPDIVTYAKKMNTAGYYCNSEFLPS